MMMGPLPMMRIDLRSSRRGMRGRGGLGDAARGGCSMTRWSTCKVARLNHIRAGLSTRQGAQSGANGTLGAKR